MLRCSLTVVWHRGGWELREVDREQDRGARIERILAGMFTSMSIGETHGK